MLGSSVCPNIPNSQNHPIGIVPWFSVCSSFALAQLGRKMSSYSVHTDTQLNLDTRLKKRGMGDLEKTGLRVTRGTPLFLTDPPVPRFSALTRTVNGHFEASQAIT